MRSLIKKIIYTSIVVGLVGIGGLYYHVGRYLDTPVNLESPLSYELQHGSNFIRVVNDLTKLDVIEQPRYLRWYGRLSGQATKIKAGEYQIEPGTTPRQLVMLLTSGKVRQYSLTLVEGWNFKQVINAIQNHPEIKQTLSGLSHEEIMQQLGHAGEHPEGRFLPDTYLFPKGLSDVAFLKRAYNAMQQSLDELWDNRAEDLPLKTPYEALIMASIVEKETGKASEREAIAGVFIRRLKKRMRLQTDPTVIYGMGEQYKGNIRRKDLLNDTPYNTYTRFGLPPTPIAMPGRDAIYASLHPDDSGSIYFVAKGDGSHYFSSSLQEHNEAVKRYQLRGNRRPSSTYRSSPQ